jgi:hypothetical protein
MADRDPKVVLQAYALRVDAARRALLHGRQLARTARRGLGSLWASLALGGVIIIVVVVTTRIVTMLHTTGH